MIIKCEDCDGHGEVLNVYPHTPLPQSPETATLEVCDRCQGTGWVVNDEE